MKRLGYNDTYHYLACLVENPRDSDIWVEAFEAKFEGKGAFERKDWDQLLGHCMALTDTPCNVFAPDLLAAYPDAKVVLSVRDDVDVWYASYMNALQPFWDHLYLEPGIIGAIKRLLVPRPRDAGMAWKLLEHTHYKDFATSGKRQYAEHNEMVLRLCKEQGRDCLVFNVKERWGPLCQFLGDPVPQGEDFPKGNDTAEMRALVSGLIAQRDAVARRNGTLMVGAVAIIVGLLKAFA